MEHSGLTAEIKEGTRRARRSADKSAVRQELDQLSDSDERPSPTEPQLLRTSSFDLELSDVELPSDPFIPLVVSGVVLDEADVLGRFAGLLIEAGVAYVCCWGEMADVLETAFDLRAVEREIEAGRSLPLLMTTSHSREPLAEAVWFWLHTAWPDPEHGNGDFPRIALCVGDDTSAARVESWIANPAVLHRELGLAQHGGRPRDGME